MLLKRCMLGAGFMLILASVEGAPDPQDIVLLDGWIEKVNRLETLGQPYTRDACLDDLLLFLRKTGNEWNFLSLRPVLTEKMGVFARGEKQDFLGKILGMLDGWLMADLSEQLVVRKDLTECGRALSGFRRFVIGAEQNLRLNERLGEIEFCWAEHLIRLMENELQGCFSIAEHEEYLKSFLSRMQAGEVLSRKVLDGITSQIRVRSPLSLLPPKVCDKYGKALELPQVKGSFIGAFLSRPQITAPEVFVPLDSCSDCNCFSSKDSVIVIPSDGIWLIKGKVDFESVPGIKRLSVQVVKNGVPIAEGTVCCLEAGQPCQSVGILGTFVFERGDKLAIILVAERPVRLLAAELSAANHP